MPFNFVSIRVLLVLTFQYHLLSVSGSPLHGVSLQPRCNLDAMQELKSALAECHGELEAVRERAATSLDGAAITLPGADPQKVTHKSLPGQADVSGQAAEARGCASASKVEDMPSSQSRQTETGPAVDLVATARSADVKDSCATEEREVDEALRVSAAAWRGALASEVDRLQARRSSPGFEGLLCLSLAVPAAFVVALESAAEICAACCIE